MVVSVHQPQYIPWAGYFDKIAKSDCFVFLDRVQYKPREFQNRNKIRIKEGWIWLTVPVSSKDKSRQAIYDVAIDNNTYWQRQHLKSLESWYGATGFFDKYFSFFEETYYKRWERLVDLNTHIIKYILKELGIDKPVYFESELDIHAARTDRIIEICRKLNAGTYLSGTGGRSYLEEDKFKDAGVELVYQDFRHPVYRQQFTSQDDGFIPCLSVLDMLFNEGPRSREFIAAERRI